MNQNVSKKPQKEINKTHLDPNIYQKRASNPAVSSWVSASAGTGKTKVLVDRVLRLLLPLENERSATDPSKILCLTFTKAGANEMALRINYTLSQWAIMPKEDPKNKKNSLNFALKDLIGRNPTESEIRAARRLFADIVETPGGLKIMTIHAFCQSILGRFPLEAGLLPNFSVLDEAPAQELLSKACDIIIRKARNQKETAENKTLNALSAELNEAQLSEYLKNICNERLQLQSILKETEFNYEVETLYLNLFDNISEILNIPSDFKDIKNEDQLNDKATLSQIEINDLKTLASILSEGGKKDQELSELINKKLFIKDTNSSSIFEFESCFLTKAGTIRKNIPSKAIREQHPDSPILFENFANKAIQFKEAMRIIKCSSLTSHLILFSALTLQEYNHLKEKQAFLDYDDLIDYTQKLLSKCDSSWVMYKLDEGIEHLLIDEAQDTNPEQWEIIKTLTSDFFTGQGAKENIIPTIFTVGDEKQSIYSFQRAAPKEFDIMKSYFSRQVKEADQKWEPQNLNISFRSTKSILKLVDEVFSAPNTSKGLGEDIVKHQSYRVGEGGFVELWPLFETEKKSQLSASWEPPISIENNSSGQFELAEFIANNIGDWLDNKEVLESKNRPIEPKDIMILVRSRNSLVSSIIRALKKRNIPVSGADRMVLGEQLPVEDLLSAAQFSLLPDDDLTLACLLKSPIINLNEDDLFKLAYNRQSSLWTTIENSNDHKEIHSYLSELINKAKTLRPFEFFNFVLHKPCPSDSVSGIKAMRSRLGNDVLDPINEFLNLTISFEKDNIPSLQEFLFWQEQNEVTIKRELEESGNFIKIMTVHASKGLQSPIVILPDTNRTQAAKRVPRFLWPDKTGLKFPVWSPRAEYDSSTFSSNRKNVEEVLDEEYRRLLYVALTRAEDRLYVGGYQTRKKPIEDSWYNYIEHAFNLLGITKDINLQNGITAKRFINNQTALIENKRSKKEEVIFNKELPGWLFEPLKSKPVPVKSVNPSKLDKEPSALSPLDKKGEYRFRRGNITHKLLEILPDLPRHLWEEAAKTYIYKTAEDIPIKIRDNIIFETISIMKDPKYSFIFGPNSFAEVPVTGQLDQGILINGVIDRLVILDKEVFIVDYKTNRPPPKNSKDIPEIYQKQMKSYSDIVRKIYKDKKIRSYLLWTDGPNLMEVN
jgi:ATP-dependent helicase/nuclease subunit A